MNENIVTRKFLTRKFANEINANYSIYKSNRKANIKCYGVSD